jgi:hypothetical protein
VVEFIVVDISFGAFIMVLVVISIQRCFCFVFGLFDDGFTFSQYGLFLIFMVHILSAVRFIYSSATVCFTG